MKSANPSSHWAKAGVFAAVAASLCCIAPVLTLLAGIGGLASAFSWLEPARPFLVGVSVVALGLAWYQQLKPKQAETDCVCEPAKPSFLQSKSFLGVVTVFAALMLAFPYYAQVFYPSAENRTEIANPMSVHTVTLDIEGMTCASCEGHVKSAVDKLPGIIETNVSFEQGRAVVRFDETQTNTADINAAVYETGYRVTQSQLDQN
ncbi:MAG: mercuric transport protein MerTP [Lewinellaceae bacterium]|nr:mercuric transport protein MerTP [Lewinellaceae bacterium]